MKRVYFIQAFVRFSAGDKEIFYVTKHSTETEDYSFELDVNEAATDFGSLSDSYTMVGHLHLSNVTTAVLHFVFNVESKVFSCLYTTCHPILVDFDCWGLCH